MFASENNVKEPRYTLKENALMTRNLITVTSCACILDEWTLQGKTPAFFELYYFSYLEILKCWVMRQSFTPEAGGKLVNLGLFLQTKLLLGLQEKIIQPCDLLRVAWQSSSAVLFFIAERCQIDLYGRFLLRIFTQQLKVKLPCYIKVLFYTLWNKRNPGKISHGWTSYSFLPSASWHWWNIAKVSSS